MSFPYDLLLESPEPNCSFLAGETLTSTGASPPPGMVVVIVKVAQLFTTRSEVTM
jgi:hypothetical protein